MTKMVFDMRDELDRKALDALSNEILRLKHKEISAETFVEATRLMWETIAGLASDSVSEKVSEVSELIRAKLR